MRGLCGIAIEDGAVLKGLIDRLRGRAAVPETVVVLNHNPADPKTPGDVSFFSEAAALVRELRGIDLEGNAYFAVDSAGRVITMRTTSDDPQSLIAIDVARHPAEAQLAQRMIRHFLLAAIDDGALDIDRQAVEREYDTRKLVPLIPGNAIEH
jgi:hypothetical protein